MKKILIFILAIFFLSYCSLITCYAQVSINTDNSEPNISAMLDVKSNNKGMLVPRMTSTQRTSINSPALGLLVFDTDTESFWFRNSSNWIELVSGNIATLSDVDDDTKIQVEESLDEDVIHVDIGGTESLVLSRNIDDHFSMQPFSANSNTYFGTRSGTATTTGAENTAFGYDAGASITTAINNTFFGHNAGKNSTTGEKNTFIGYRSGEDNITGNFNTYIGRFAGFLNDGSSNIFIGTRAGSLLTNGDNLLYIENSNSNTPLIYGEFDNDWVKVNGHLSASDGFADADNDTKIQVEESADEDVIRFDVAGTEVLTIDKNANGDTQIEGFHDANIMIGNNAGNTSVGPRNILIGNSTGLAFDDSEDFANVVIGTEAGNSFDGYRNVIIGDQAGKSATAINESVMIGMLAGENSNVIGGIYIGHEAGRNETLSNRLHIGSGPLIYGVLPSAGGTPPLVEINGQGHGDSYYALTVDNLGPAPNERRNGIRIRAGENNEQNGSRFLACVTPDGDIIGTIRQNGNGSVNFDQNSDIRLKTNIVPTQFGLTDLMKIQVRDYSFKSELDRTRTGFIAQQLYNHFPEAVSVGGIDVKNNAWGVDYGKLTPLLVKAVQDQQSIINTQQAEIEQLKSQNARIQRLEQQMTKLLAQNAIDTNHTANSEEK